MQGAREAKLVFEGASSLAAHRRFEPSARRDSGYPTRYLRAEMFDSYGTDRPDESRTP